MKTKTELHECAGCGHRARLTTGKRHWCACNKATPFRMESAALNRHLARALALFAEITSRHADDAASRGASEEVSS